MSNELLTDEKAARLLALLRDYAVDAIQRNESLESILEMRFKELAGDLFDSLPRVLIPGDTAFITGDAMRGGR